MKRSLWLIIFTVLAFSAWMVLSQDPWKPGQPYPGACYLPYCWSGTYPISRPSPTLTFTPLPTYTPYASRTPRPTRTPTPSATPTMPGQAANHAKISRPAQPKALGLRHAAPAAQTQQARKAAKKSK